MGGSSSEEVYSIPIWKEPTQMDFWKYRAKKSLNRFYNPFLKRIHEGWKREVEDWKNPKRFKSPPPFDWKETLFMCALFAVAFPIALFASIVTGEHQLSRLNKRSETLEAM